MAKYTRQIEFDATDELQASMVSNALKDILAAIPDKKHLIELAAIVKKKPGLIQMGIPYLKRL